MNKEINADSRVTDRFIYNEAISVRNALIKQESARNRMYTLDSIFSTLNKVELINVDTIEACGIDSGCVIKRTKDKLPKVMETVGGIAVKSITSLDGSKIVNLITESSFIKKVGSNDKHAKKELYAYFRGDYLYLPNVPWNFVRIEAVFEDPDSVDTANSCDEETDCDAAYDRTFPIPNYLESPLKQLLNESLARYYHRLLGDHNVNKNPA